MVNITYMASALELDPELGGIPFPLFTVFVPFNVSCKSPVALYAFSTA